MKLLYKNILWIFLLGLWACEKNDPLSDQGELTGNLIPFNLLAQMPDAATGDTLSLRTVTWAVEDDINTVEFHHWGFKRTQYTIRMRFDTEHAGIIDHDLTITPDTIHYEKQFIAAYPNEQKSLNDFYQTQQNAYVVTHDFVVPQQYKLVRLSDGELLENLNDDIFETLAHMFTGFFDRDLFYTVFPEVGYFSLTYYEVEDGSYTGNITQEAVEYLLENLTREKVIESLRSADAEDNTRVTVESISVLENEDAFKSSERVFRVTQ